MCNIGKGTTSTTATTKEKKEMVNMVFLFETFLPIVFPFFSPFFFYSVQKGATSMTGLYNFFKKFSPQKFVSME